MTNHCSTCKREDCTLEPGSKPCEITRRTCHACSVSSCNRELLSSECLEYRDLCSFCRYHGKDDLLYEFTNNSEKALHFDAVQLTYCPVCGRKLL